MKTPPKKSLSYRDAGVDINAGEELVEKIKPIAKATSRPEVMGGLGGFGALFDLTKLDYKEPVLVSGTDGVGTKLKLAIETRRHSTVGIDLVAMCVNDVIVQGAEPLFFLDYMATAALDTAVAEKVITGIGEGCIQAGAALIGGETAEMPGMYQGSDYDLAGFCVGVVEKSKIITGQSVKPGDHLIAMASSGPHANGYSLIRKVLDVSRANLGKPFQGGTLGDALMAPTRIYVKSLLALFGELPVHALAHITGGGLPGNLPRVLPDNTRALIQADSWNWPDIFLWLQNKGNIEIDEMLRTFNCGVGMVLVVREEDVDRALGILKTQGENAWLLGKIEAHTGAPEIQII